MAAVPAQQPAWLRLSAAELAEKGIAPVKHEHMAFDVQQPGAAEEKPKSQGEAQDGTTPSPASDQRPAAAAKGNGAEQAHAAGKVEKKSKRQMIKERKERQQKDRSGLCVNFAKGICTFGTACRWSHDVKEYLANKAPDLPGDCPFANTHERCPYGFMCRWSAAHPPAQSADPNAAEAPRHEAAPPQALEPKIRGAAVENDGSLPSHVPVPLPPLSEKGSSVNELHKDLQTQLRKNQYDFSRADAVLDDLGVKVKLRGKQQKPKPPQAPKPAEDAAGGDAEQPAKRAKTDAAPDSGGDGVVKLFDVSRASEGNGAYRVGAGRAAERKPIDWNGKLVLAPLTTTGNLPFRRLCKTFGADITVGEMALATCILQGHSSEWALMRRHSSEDIFGVQICGGFPDALARCAQLIEDNIDCDFVDINCGCPIDLVCNKGAGSSLLRETSRLEKVVRAASSVLTSRPLTVKVRAGYYGAHPSDASARNVAHELVRKVGEWGASAMTIHGRTRQQRYAKLADWDYIAQCARADGAVPVIGNGDIYSWQEHRERTSADRGVTATMLARGALIKPWLFTEIKEERDWDISASERLDMIRDYARFGLDHWGSDSRGVETTRRFLLEWLSYLHRYIPVGLLEVLPARMHWRPPPRIVGRSQLETLLSSDDPRDWIRISEMFLGPAPQGFQFTPKHKSTSYATDVGYGSMAAAVPTGNNGGNEDEENG
ncbi:unnamed protein product [Pedinophyceae sp. YPF-701]|nr:unnamed protein product [Pedinophyceae sp. YPF-701]